MHFNLKGYSSQKQNKLYISISISIYIPKHGQTRGIIKKKETFYSHPGYPAPATLKHTPRIRSSALPVSHANKQKKISPRDPLQ